MDQEVMGEPLLQDKLRKVRIIGSCQRSENVDTGTDNQQLDQGDRRASRSCRNKPRETDVSGHWLGDLKEPGSDNCIRFESGGVLGEIGEDGLGDFLGELGRTDLPERGGVNESNMLADEFSKGVLRAVASVACEQLPVAVGLRVAHFQKYIAAGQGNPTRKLRRTVTWVASNSYPSSEMDGEAVCDLD